MAVDVKLPELGEGVTEGELVKWLVKPGDSVKADQSIAEVMTDKATVEVPSPVAGVVKELKFKPGQIIKVESVMLTLEAINGVATKATSSAPPPSTPVASHGSSAGGHIEVKLPELGEGVTEGEIVRWLVKPGDSVKADQAIAEVMTDKATVEVPSPFAGVVKELKFKVGEVVKVESTLLVLEGSAPAGASRSASHSASPTSKPLPAAAHMNFASQTTPSVASTGAAPQASGALEIYPPAAESRVLATPATRRLARELGVDINNIKGTGLAGRVTRDDVLAAKGQATAPSLRPQTQAPSLPKPAYHGPAGALEERVPLVGIRKKIAENMQRSKAIIPHFTIMDEADVTELVALRESLRDYAEKAGTKITYLPFVIKALIATVREFPMFVASIDDAANEIVYKKYFNIGFAADTPNGLVVPVIKDADKKSILEISKEILDLSKRARDGKLKPEEMKGACITITNIGSIGGTYATPVINHPEVAILGMYKIEDKLYLKDGAVASKKTMNFTATCDHRLIDGAVAARFLAAFIARIEKPGRLMMEMM